MLDELNAIIVREEAMRPMMLLEQEGVAFKPNGCVDMKQCKRDAA